MDPPVLTGSERKIVVGISELSVSNNPADVLTTYSLGSCLGIAIYDRVARVAGLLHAMLPDSDIAPSRARSQPGLFIDTGVPALFRTAYELGAEKHRLRIYVAGGAQVMDACGYFNIGRRNCDTLTALLARHGLRIEAEQTGGMVNRTLCVNVGSGEVCLKISGQITEFPLCKS